MSRAALAFLLSCTIGALQGQTTAWYTAQFGSYDRGSWGLTGTLTETATGLGGPGADGALRLYPGSPTGADYEVRTTYRMTGSGGRGTRLRVPRAARTRAAAADVYRCMRCHDWRCGWQ